MRTSGGMRAGVGVLVGMMGACDPATPVDASSTEATGSTGSTRSPGSTGEAPTLGTSAAVTTMGSVDGTTTGSADSSGEGGSSGASGGCLEQLTLDETFVLSATETGQIHPHVRFDPRHQGVWLTYNRRASDGSSNFEVAMTRVGCDGVVQVAPWTVSTSSQNHVDAELAFTAERVLVLWTGDDGSGGAGNLDVLTRVLDRDGNPLEDAERPLALTRGGAPFVESAWMAHVAAAPDGTFTVAGTRAVDEAAAFQLFIQRLDADGVASGDTLEPSMQPGVAHTEPRIAVADDGTAHVAWSRTADFSAYEVAALSLPAADGGDAVAVATLGEEGDHAAVAAGAHVLWGKSTALPDGRGIRAYPAVAGVPLALGEAGRIDYGPAIAMSETGAAMAWYRLLGGPRNELVVARIDGVGTDALVAGAPRVLPDVEAAPYPAALTHVGGDTYLVAWSQGTSPEFVVYGRFFELGR